MATIPVKIKKIINRYFKILKKNNISIQKAVLFGSYARGDNNKWSDIDLAIVSELFEGNRIKDKNKIRSITLSVSSDLEILPFSPKEFNVNNPFVKEILRTGIVLKNL